MPQGFRFQLVLRRCSDGKLLKIFRSEKKTLMAAKKRMVRQVTAYVVREFGEPGNYSAKGTLHFVTGNRKTRIRMWTMLCYYIDYE